MPTLPDVTSLGTPSGSAAGRGVAGYGTPAYAHPIAPVEPIKNSPVEAPVVDTGAGLRAVGQGLEKAASAAAYTYGHLVADQRKLAFGQADSFYINESTKIKQAIDQSSNIDEINQYKSRLSELPGEAAANLPEDQRELYMLKQSRYVADDMSHADKRIYSVTKAGDISATYGTLDELSSAYATATDDKTRAYIHDTAGTLYDQLAAKGYYTPEQIQEYKNKWTIGAVKDRNDLLPPEQRIVALGGVLPGKIAANDLPQHAVSLLNAIGAPESNGKYNVRYTANGGVEFSDLSQHPNIPEKILTGPNAGKTSTAAGRYQFLKSTWDNIPAEYKGDGSFSEANQDHAAWYLAQDDYFARTGRSLDTDLRTNGLTPEIVSKLGDTWEGLKVNPKKALAAYNATMSGRTDVTAMLDSGDREASVLPIDTRLRMLQQAISEQNRVTSDQLAARKELEHGMQADVQMVAETGLPMQGMRERVASTFGNDVVAQHDAERERASAYFSATKAMDKAPDAELDKIVAGLAPVSESPDYPAQRYWYDKVVKIADDLRSKRSKDPAAAVENSDYVQEARKSYDPSNPASYQNVVKARLMAQTDLAIPKELQMVMPDEEAKRYASVMRPMTRGQANVVMQKDLINSVANDISARFGQYSQKAWQQIGVHVNLKGDAADYLDAVVTQINKNQPPPPPTADQAQKMQMERDRDRAISISGGQQPQAQPGQISQPGAMPSTPKPAARGFMPDTGAYDLLRSDPDKMMPFFLKKFGPDYVPVDLINKVPPEELKKRKVWYPDANAQVDASND